MKKSEILVAALILAIVGIIAVSCTWNGNGNSNSSEDSGDTKTADKLPLNLTVYLDLSDRLLRDNVTPSQMSNDTAIISYLFKLFLDRNTKNMLRSKDHFQVFFYPAPGQSNINSLAKALDLDLAAVKPQDKKKEIIRFRDTFKDNVSTIYRTSLDSKQWVGSDIWSFFSNQKVDSYSMRQDYRNVLVILTDGYLFYAPNKITEGDSYSYVLPQTLVNPKSSLIVRRTGLENLEVLMLEINPYTPLQRDALVKVLNDWFLAMGVKKFVINETDIEKNTESIIQKFIQS